MKILKLISSFCALLICNILIAQDVKSDSVEYTVTIDRIAPYSPEAANRDIKENKLKILFKSSLFEDVDFSDKSDIKFQKKYSVEFISRGCAGFEGDNPEAYNKIIFRYLDKKYGKDWRREIKKGAIGI